MPLYINNKKVEDVYLNENAVSKIYLDGEIVYQKKYFFSFDTEKCGWEQGEWYNEE